MKKIYLLTVVLILNIQFLAAGDQNEKQLTKSENSCNVEQYSKSDNKISKIAGFGIVVVSSFINSFSNYEKYLLVKDHYRDAWFTTASYGELESLHNKSLMFRKRSLRNAAVGAILLAPSPLINKFFWK